MGVHLANGDATNPEGDWVQVVVPWSLTEPFAGLCWHDIEPVIKETECSIYGMSMQSGDRWLGKLLSAQLGLTEAAAKWAIKLWLNLGLIGTETYKDKETGYRERTRVIVLPEGAAKAKARLMSNPMPPEMDLRNA